MSVASLMTCTFDTDCRFLAYDAASGAVTGVFEGDEVFLAHPRVDGILPRRPLALDHDLAQAIARALECPFQAWPLASDSRPQKLLGVLVATTPAGLLMEHADAVAVQLMRATRYYQEILREHRESEARARSARSNRPELS